MQDQPRALKISKNWSKPFLAGLSDSGLNLGYYPVPFQKRVPGNKAQSQTTVIATDHFLREDNGEDLVKTLNYWFEQ